MTNDKKSQKILSKGYNDAYITLAVAFILFGVPAFGFAAVNLQDNRHEGLSFWEKLNQSQEKILHGFDIASGDPYGFLGILATVGIAVGIAMFESYGRLRRIRAEDEERDIEQALHEIAHAQSIGHLQCLLLLGCGVISYLFLFASLGGASVGVSIASGLLSLFFYVEFSRCMLMVQEWADVRKNPYIKPMKMRIKRAHKKAKQEKDGVLLLLEIWSYLAVAVLVGFSFLGTDSWQKVVHIGIFALLMSIPINWITRSQALQNSYKAGSTRIIEACFAYFYLFLMVTIVVLSIVVIVDASVWGLEMLLICAGLVILLAEMTVRAAGYSGNRPANGLLGFRLTYKTLPSDKFGSRKQWLVAAIATVIEVVIPAMVFAITLKGWDRWGYGISLAVLCGAGVTWPYFSPQTKIRHLRQTIVGVVSILLPAFDIITANKDVGSIEKATAILAWTIWVIVLIVNYWPKELPKSLAMLASPRLVALNWLGKATKSLKRTVKKNSKRVQLK